MSTVNNGHSKKITVLSFILAILVVIRHAVNISVYGLTGGVLYSIERIISEITDLAVPSFFAMSGFLFFINFSWDKLLSKWKRRVKSIVIPYFVWNLIPYIAYVCISAIPAVGSKINQQIEPLTFLNILRNGIWGYHNITWFLRNLILYSLITPFLFHVLRNKIAGMITLISLLIANHWINNDYFCYYSIYFLGAYLGVNFSEQVYRRFSKRVAVLSAIVLSVTLLLRVCGLYDSINSNSFYYALRSVQVILLWICMDLFSFDLKIRWWMKISFFIYCSHSFIMEGIQKLILIVLGHSMIGAWVDFLCSPIITIAIILCLASFLRKTKYLWPILSGGR